MDEIERCPACGEPMKGKVSVGAFYLCRKCTSRNSLDIALKIAKSKHREKLEQIWEMLENQTSENS